MDDDFFDKDLLISLIDGLGYFSEDSLTYQKNKDTLECLKDIERFLRLDFEDNKQALLTVGQCNVVSRNLLPLLKTFPHDEQMVYHTLKVIVLMTMPPKDGEHPQSVLEVHHAAKAAFTDRTSLAIVTSICLDALKDLPEMRDEQYKILQLFLTFIRNMMLIPDSEDWESAVSKHHYATLQVDFLKVALDESVLDMVGCVLQHIENKKLREDASISLDILYGVYVSFDPQAVYNADLQDAVRSRAKASTKNVHGNNAAQKHSSRAFGNEPEVHPTIAHMSVRKPTTKQPSRHPGVKLIRQSGEQAYYVRSTPGMQGHTILKNAAKTKAAMKVHATVHSSNGPRVKSATTNRQLLASIKAYTSQLLCGPFDTLVSIIRDEASLGLHVAGLERRSFFNLFWVSSWFMQFLRHQDEARVVKSSKKKHSKSMEPSTSVYSKVSSMLSWRMIQTVLRVWLDVVDTDGKQKKAADWQLQEVSLKALRELITFLDMAYHYGSDSDKQKAEKLEIQLLQDDTKEAGVLNRVLQSMRSFKKHDKKVPRQEGRESRGYAVDMVKMLHVVLRVYERICKSGFVLQRESNRVEDQSDSSDDDNEERQGQDELERTKEDADAVEQPSTPTPSLLADQDIAQKSAENAHVEGPTDGMVDDIEVGTAEEAEKQTDKSPADNAELYTNDAVDVKGGKRARRETRVDFDKVLKMASHADVIELYLFVLQRYKTLDAHTLHAISSFLTCICDRLNLEPVLYQVCHLRQFHIILSDDDIQDRSSFKSLLKFARRMVTNLFARLDPKPVSLEKQRDEQDAKQNDLEAVLRAFPPDKKQAALQEIQTRITNVLFVELLFAKGPREAEMINREYNWQPAVQRKMADLGFRDPAQEGIEHFRDGDHSSDDEDDAVPESGVARTEEEKAAAKRASQLARTGFGEEEVERFTSMFETMNGRQALRMMLLEDWNNQETKKLTTKDLSRVMGALQLKQGVLTANQETKLRELVVEFSSEGKKAYTLIANALPGGFSVIAIKRNMARLGLTVSKNEDETPAGSDQSEDDYERDDISPVADVLGDLDEPGVPLKQKESKQASKKQRKRSKALFDAIAKKQRSAIDAEPGHAEPGHELEDGEGYAEDLMDIDEGVGRQDALLSSDDDAHANSRLGRRDNNEHNTKAKTVSKPRRDKNLVKAQKTNARGKVGSKQAVLVALAAVVKEGRTSYEGSDVSGEDIAILLGDLLQSCLLEEPCADTKRAQFLLEGSNPAEEMLLEMHSIGDLLEALGLCYVADADDPRVWRMGKGRAKPQSAVQALCKLLTDVQKEPAKTSHRVNASNEAHASPAVREASFGLEDEDDLPSAVQLAAASVPASLLDDSDEDMAPAAPSVKLSHSNHMDKELAGSPTVPHSKGQMHDDDEVEDAGMGLQGQQVAKKTHLLDDDEIANADVHEAQPVQEVRIAEAAPLMCTDDDPDEVAALPTTDAQASDLDDVAAALEDTHPNSVVQASLLDDSDSDVPHSNPGGEAQQAVPTAGSTQCTAELPAHDTAGHLDSGIKECVLVDTQVSYPCFAGTEGSQAIAVASFPETEESQVAHVAPNIGSAHSSVAPSAVVLGARSDEQEELEDPETQMASEHNPAVPLQPSPSQKNQPEACHDSPAKQHEEDPSKVVTDVSLPMSASGHTNDTEMVPVDTTHASGSCQKPGQTDATASSLENELSPAQPEAPVPAGVQNGADAALPANETHEAADAGACDTEEQLPVGAQHGAHSMTPKLRASGMLLQRSQGSLSVTFSDLEMDMETGLLYPHGDCNDTARKRQERWQRKRSLKRSAGDGGAAPRNRTSFKEDDEPPKVPMNVTETGTEPEAGANAISTPLGEPCQRKRPRTKKARLEAKRSQSSTQPSREEAHTPDCPQRPDQFENVQAENPASQVHREPNEEIGDIHAAVGADSPSQPAQLPCASTPHAKRPRTKKARLEMKQASALASQTPSAQHQACTSSGGQSPIEQQQQENIALQPGDLKLCVNKSVPTAKHLGPGQQSPQLQPMDL